MNDLQIFKNNEFGEIRTTVIKNEPYLMLNDVCRILELNNVSQVKSRLSDNQLKRQLKYKKEELCG